MKLHKLNQIEEYGGNLFKEGNSVSEFCQIHFLRKQIIVHVQALPCDFSLFLSLQFSPSIYI